MLGSTPGRCTLMATSSPDSRSVALYTCPSEAAAMGPGEMRLNTSVGSRPSVSRMIPNASASGKAGTSSCSTQSSSM